MNDTMVAARSFDPSIWRQCRCLYGPAPLASPGADGFFLLYEDDGSSFNYRKGEWMGIEITWNDRQRLLRLTLSTGSRMLPPLRRDLVVKSGGATRRVVFDGHPLDVRF